MEARNIRSDMVEVGAAATIAVETAGRFVPIDEFGDDAYFTKHYEGRKDLGNIEPGDGVRFHGRGQIQLTGRSNYLLASPVAGVDLVANPEKALDPAISAKLSLWFFEDRHVSDACNVQDWKAVRRRVNGGYNGWDGFILKVRGLLATLQ
jgi:predicted chitinase